MYDDAIAQSEGWALFETGDGLQIQKIDEMDTFKSDEDAWIHVVGKARNGSPMHISALGAVHAEELAIIKSYTGWDGN